MNIYHVHQKAVRGYDTYSDFVVIANSEEEAKNIYPGSEDARPVTIDSNQNKRHDWPTDIKDITADYIGMAKDSYDKVTIICSSFHAG